MGLKDIREQKHITLKGVSKELNLHRNTLAKIEEGMAELPTRCLRKLSGIYGISIEEVIEIHEEDILGGREENTIKRT